VRTLSELIPRIANLGRREAIRSMSAYRTRTATYADLYGKIGAIAAYLDDKGLRKGDRVMVRAANGVEWVAFFWACIARGVQIVPVDVGFSTDLASRIYRDSAATLAIDNEDFDRLSHLPHIQQVTCAAISPDDIVEIIYTSGTTGEPKGVVHRHRNICANLEPFEREIAKYRRWAAPFQPIRILDLLPLSHMFGQSMALYIPIFLGGAVAFTDQLQPANIVNVVRSNRISVIVGVPRLLELLR